jgi:ketosteroid isomerase-like protein
VTRLYRMPFAAATTRKGKGALAAILPRVATENEDVVRRAIVSITQAQRDASADDLRKIVAEFWDFDADYYPARKFPEAQPCHGLDEINQFFVRFREMWSSFEWVVREVIDVAGERALAHITLHAEGRQSGANLEGDVFQCYWLRHGRFIRGEDHLTLKGALHALGVKEETLEAAGLRTPTNLDLVRSIYAAWERGDFSSAEWAHPEIEFVIVGGPEPGSWKEVAGMVEGFRGILSAFEGWRTEAEEYRELDGERVFVLVHLSGRGKTSGLDVGQMRAANGANLFHIDGGKVTRLVIYWDREHALAELGLSSETGSSSS